MTQELIQLYAARLATGESREDALRRAAEDLAYLVAMTREAQIAQPSQAAQEPAQPSEAPATVQPPAQPPAPALGSLDNLYKDAIMEVLKPLGAPGMRIINDVEKLVNERLQARP